MSRIAIKELKNHLAVPNLKAQLAVLAAQGLVTLPSQKPLKKIRRVKVSGRPVSKKMLDDRR